MADYFVDSAATGARNGSSETDAWNTIERPVDGTDDWTGGAVNSGGPLTGSGHTVWFKDTHNESWDQLAGHYTTIDPVATVTAPIVFRVDDGSHSWTLTGSRPNIGTAPSTLAYFRTASNSVYLSFYGLDFTRLQSLGNPSPDYLFEFRGYDTHVVFDDCRFYKYKGLLFLDSGSYVEFLNCTFDGTDYGTAGGQGIYVNNGVVRMRNCTYKRDASNFGADAFFTTANRQNLILLEDVTISNFTDAFHGDTKVVNVEGRNVDLSGCTNEISSQSDLTPWSHIQLQDIDDNPRLAKHYLQNGTLYTAESAGGRDVVGKCAPNVNCHAWSPIKLFEFWVPADAGVSATYSVDFYATNWTTRPDASELVFEVGYYASASSSSRTWVETTDTIDADDTWYTLSVSGVNPSEDGTVILRAWLKLSEGGTEEIWYDISGDFKTYWFLGWPYRSTGGGGSFMLIDDGGLG